VAAAFLGNDTALRHVAAHAEVPGDAAEAAADVLVKASIFEQVHPVRFAHPIVRSAIAADSSPAGAAAAHRRAALLLKAGGESMERIIPHLLLSAPAGDEWVVDSLHQAAQDALARGVPEMASRCLRRALDEPPVSGHAGLLAELSAAELANGAYEQSALAARRAIEMAPDPAARARFRLQEVYGLLSVGGAQEALATLEKGVVEAGTSDPELTLQLETELVLHSWFTDLVHPMRDRLVGYRNLQGQTLGERYMLTVLALEALRNSERAEIVRDLAVRGLSGGRLVAEASASSMPYFVGVVALMAAEAYDDAREEIEAGMRNCRARGSQYGYAGVCWIRGLLAHAEGNLIAAEADERACIEHAVPTMVGIGVACLALMLLEQGDVPGAHSELERGGLLSDARPLYLWGPYVRGLVRLARGEPAAALADFRDVGRHAVQIGGATAGLPWRAQLALAYQALGDRYSAQESAGEELELARSFGANRRLGVALRTAALVSRGDAHINLLTEAVKVLEVSPAKLELAHARYDLGVALLRAGRRREGRQLLEKSHDGARECGAKGLAQNSHEELRIAGARPRGIMFAGVESLTASERRVAEMAAAGMTNRDIAQALFVTPKTVENQLGRVYGKLEVNSRRALSELLKHPVS
jgi:DNA-binding CsgD family transcriptional regulator